MQGTVHIDFAGFYGMELAIIHMRVSRGNCDPVGVSLPKKCFDSLSILHVELCKHVSGMAVIGCSADFDAAFNRCAQQSVAHQSCCANDHQALTHACAF